MADAVVKESSTLDVTLIDAAGYDATFKINNPRTSGLSLAIVRQAFSSLFAGGEFNTSGRNVLSSRYGNSFTGVQTAAITEVVTRKTALE